MRSINAERELNREERFKIFTPIIAIWDVLKEMANSNGVEKDEYTKKDFASMAIKAEMDNSEEIANMLSKPLEAEKKMQEVKQKEISEIIVNRVPKRMKEPEIVNVKLDNEKEDLER